MEETIIICFTITTFSNLAKQATEEFLVLTRLYLEFRPSLVRQHESLASSHLPMLILLN